MNEIQKAPFADFMQIKSENCITILN